MLHLFAVRFRFIVFRPFVDEILVGKIRSCITEVQYGFVLRLSHSCRCVKEGVNFLCDVLVCSFICFNQCLMPSPHTKLCSSFYFGCQLCQAFLAYMLLRMVCMEMIGTVSFCCVSSFQFLWASLMTF